MPKSDAIYAVIISFLLAAFILPVLKATGFWDKFPNAFMFSLLGIVPIFSVVGMFIAYKLGRKIPLAWQFSKFALVGTLNTAIDFGVLNLLITLTGITSGPSIIPLNAFAFSVAVVNSYFWNKKWVFADAKRGDFVVFFIVTTIGIAINSGILYAVTTFIEPIIVTDRTLWANIAKVLATGLSLIWNFAGYRLVVFKK